MNKRTPIPPRHRVYPRAHAMPLRPAPVPPPRPVTSWVRAVPDGRTFPRA